MFHRRKFLTQVIGSAPLAGSVLTFARCALGCLVVEGKIDVELLSR